MSQRTDSLGPIVGGATGGTMAISPMLAVPFYETEVWATSVAVLGMAVLLTSLAVSIRNLFK